MKLFILKDNEELVVKMKKEKEQEDFDYIQMIDYLYNNPGVEIECDYSSEISPEEKKKIEELFEEIYIRARNDV